MYKRVGLLFWNVILEWIYSTLKSYEVFTIEFILNSYCFLSFLSFKKKCLMVTDNCDPWSGGDPYSTHHRSFYALTTSNTTLKGVHKTFKNVFLVLHGMWFHMSGNVWWKCEWVTKHTVVYTYILEEAYNKGLFSH